MVVEKQGFLLLNEQSSKEKCDLKVMLGSDFSSSSHARLKVVLSHRNLIADMCILLQSLQGTNIFTFFTYDFHSNVLNE